MDERDHLLGLHGLALLRAGAAGNDSDVAEHREAMQVLLATESGGASRTLRSVSAAEGYRHWAASYDGRANPTIAAEQEAVRSLLAGRAPGDAVDVGCGTGRHTRWLVDQGHRVTGIDGSPEMLARAASAVPEAQLLAADITRLPLADGCADIVVCALVLSHLCDLSPIGELARLLRPGGRLVISNPHPFATGVLGSRAWTTTPGGERVSVPEYAHPLGAYVAAFSAAGLTPAALWEPRHLGEDALVSAEPAVVVWAADRRADESD